MPSASAPMQGGSQHPSAANIVTTRMTRISDEQDFSINNMKAGIDDLDTLLVDLSETLYKLEKEKNNNESPDEAAEVRMEVMDEDNDDEEDAEKKALNVAERKKLQSDIDDLLAKFKSMLDVMQYCRIQKAVIEGMKTNLMSGWNCDGTVRRAPQPPRPTKRKGKNIKKEKVRGKGKGKGKETADNMEVDGEEEEEEEEEDGGEEEEEEAEQEPEPEPVLFKKFFENEVALRVKKYNSLSDEEKYHPVPEYVDLKKKMWEARYPDKPFNLDGSQANDDEDDEIAIVGEQTNFNCPLTMVLMEEPYTSKVCKHSFSSAIFEHIRKARPPQRAECPIVGCNKYIVAGDFFLDKSLARRVARKKKQQLEDEQNRHLSQMRNARTKRRPGTADGGSSQNSVNRTNHIVDDDDDE
ncbi:hypothetical protein HDU76_002403 [Blyttiomyces sp. JEL0837]|nr:hypothetical protein HDU76_002403 [Blyttiomyces sp. JEL0837]